MATRAQIAQWARDEGIELIFYDPPEHFDHAIVGLVRGHGQEWAVVYDEAMVLKSMAAGSDAETAEEWFEFNTIGAYLGEATPRFLNRPWEVDDVEET